MDLFKAIEYLRDEKKRVDQLIDSIERLGVPKAGQELAR